MMHRKMIWCLRDIDFEDDGPLLAHRNGLEPASQVPIPQSYVIIAGDLIGTSKRCNIGLPLLISKAT